MAAAWSQISDDIVGLILQKLPPKDCIRSCSVCRLWKSIINSNKLQQRHHHNYKSNSPWLMLPGPGKNAATAKFFSLADKRTYKIPLPPPAINRRICIGSSFGWLITVTETLDLHLLNPLTGVQIQLPSITTLPSVAQVARDAQGQIERFVLIDDAGGDGDGYPFTRDNMLHHFLEKAVLSSAPLADGSGDFTVCVLHRPANGMAFVRPGDDRWTVARARCLFADLISYRGSIHTLTRKGKVEKWELDRPAYPLTISKEFGTNAYVYYSKYLVESVRGELFMVLRRRRCSHDRPAMVTAHFKLLVWEEKEREWKRVDDMGDNVIFVGNNLSMCLSAKEFPELRRNCIYFTDDLLMMSSLYQRWSRDMGVFDMVKKRIEPIASSLGRHLNWPPPIWVTPTFS